MSLTYSSVVLLALWVLVSAPLSKPTSLHGTLIIMVSCKDGIVVASDSRSVIRDYSGVDIGYFEAKDKSLCIGSNVIAFAGRTDIGNTTVSDYALLVPDSIARQGPESLIKGVQKALLEKGPPDAVNRVLENLIILSAGYVDGNPVLCKTSKGSRAIDCSQRVVSNMIIPEKLKLQLTQLQVSIVSTHIDQIYNATAKEFNNIGGPIRIWNIYQRTPAVTCVQKCEDYSKRAIAEYYRAILNKEIELHLMNGKSEEYVHAYIRNELKTIDP